MFSNLADFSQVRSTKQALGFYLAYLVLGFILGAVAGALGSTLFAKGGSVSEVYEAAVKSGLVVAIAYPIVVSFMIVRAKKLTKNFTYILLTVLAGVLGYFGGALLGLIPAAYLSTRKK